MKRIAEIGTWLAGRLGGLRVQLRLCLRMSLAAVLTYVLSQSLHLPLPLWAVLTSVIVTQMSVGKSLKATLDYMEGTLGGAVYSGAIATLLPHQGSVAISVMLVLAVAPLALLAATSSRFSTAPFTAVMVVLIPSMTHVSAFDSAFYRVIEVALGCAVSLAVSFVVLPELARNLVIESAARLLEMMAQAFPRLIGCLKGTQDAAELARVQDSLGKAFIQLTATAAEARRERVAYFNPEPDPQQLLDALLRLRHDLIIVGRAAVQPFPPALRDRLSLAIAEVTESGADYLRSASAAFAAHRAPPSLDRYDSALHIYVVAFAAARRDGLTRDLATDAAERIFALGFALEQLRENFRGLQRCFEFVIRLRHGAPISEAPR